MMRLFVLIWIAGSPFFCAGQDAEQLKVLISDQTASNPIGLAAFEQNRRQFLVSAEMEKGVVVRDVQRSGFKTIAKIPSADLGGLAATSIRIKNNVALIALGNFFRRESKAGLAIIDLEDPSQPKLVGLWKSIGMMEGAAIVEASKDIAFLGGMSAGVIVLDISNPENIRHITTFQPNPHFPIKNPNRIQRPNARGMQLVGKRLYVAYDAGGLRVIDVADPTNPREIGMYINSKMIGKQQAYNNIAVHRHTAFIGVDYAGLEIVDTRDPANIKQIGWWNPWKAGTWQNLWLNSPGHANEVLYDSRKQLVYLSAGDSELQVIDVSNLLRPVLKQRIGQPKNGEGVWGVCLGSRFVFAGYIKTVVPFRGEWSGIRAALRSR